MLFHFCSCAFQIYFTLSKNYFLHSSIFSSRSSCFPLPCTVLYCGTKGPTCKQFPYKIKLGPVPFHIGALACLGSCLLQVCKLVRTEANGWKSLTNLSNSCFQSPLFIVLAFNHVSQSSPPPHPTPSSFCTLLLCQNVGGTG